MIATHNQQATSDKQTLDVSAEGALQAMQERNRTLEKVRRLPSSLLMPSHVLMHHPRAGLNPLVDTASYLFSILGRLRHLKSYRQLQRLQKELIAEINNIQEAIKDRYSNEYVLVCRYVLCATLDDVISNTAWGGQGQWEPYALLEVYLQDARHEEKFFTILDRIVKEPALYIDLMELMYICLSLGYKGQYRATEHHHYMLEKITNHLYQHIHAYRGGFSKTLSPALPKLLRPVANQDVKKPPLIFIFFVTACIIMTIFVSLGYLMDVISNEAYQNISHLTHTAEQKPDAS